LFESTYQVKTFNKIQIQSLFKVIKLIND